MNTILFFHTSQRQAWRKELAGAYRFARVRNWRVQVVEPSARPPDIPALIAFWNPVGCIAECSGMASGYFDVASFGDVPVVFLGRDPRTLPPSASFITPAAQGAGAYAAREFLAQGLTSFAFLSSPENHFWSRDRESEFTHVVRLNGFACNTFGRTERFRSAAARTNALVRWLKSLPKPCGLMAENDYAAVEVLDIARKMRIDVPGDISVIGVDNDSDLCENARPKLSSILLDFEHAGYRALEILDAIVRDPSCGPIRETYPALGLMRRGSTPAGAGVPPRILDALTFIRDKACEGISAADVARQLQGSRRLAEIEFRNATGKSILEEILRVRFEKVELLLHDRSRRLGGIAHLCGWKTENALRAAFLKRYGVSMRDWRRRRGLDTSGCAAVSCKRRGRSIRMQAPSRGG